MKNKKRFLTSILKTIKDEAGNDKQQIALDYLDLSGFESGIDENGLFEILSTSTGKYGLFTVESSGNESWLVLDADYISGKITQIPELEEELLDFYKTGEQKRFIFSIKSWEEFVTVNPMA